MNYQISKPNQVSVCHKQSCVHASGKNAERIATATGIMLLFIGLAALIKALR